MRLTDFIAELVSIENYQKLLINKSRKYQIKNIRKGEVDSLRAVGDQDALFTEDDEGQTPGKEQQDEASRGLIDSQKPTEPRRLNAEYFEAKLLKESERSVEWLLDQLKPETSRKDRLILQEITGYDYGGGGDSDANDGEINYSRQERSGLKLTIQDEEEERV